MLRLAVDAVAREVVAWAGTPAGLLAMMAHRGKQDLVALATAVLRRGALLAVLKAGDLADRERVGEDEIVAEATPQDLENPAPPWPSVPQNAWSREQTEGELVGRGVLAPDALGVLRPTVFGLLCYGRQPQAHRDLRSAFVGLCRYAGTDRAADVILRGEAKGRLDAQVEAAVLDVARYDVFKLGEAVLSGRVARALRMLDGLRAEGEAPVLVHWTLAEDIRALARVHAAVAEGQPLPLALREARVWGQREKLFERALPMLSAAALQQLVRAASVCDGLVKGLRQPDWPDDAWDGLRRLVLLLLQPLSTGAAKLALQG